MLTGGAIAPYARAMTSCGSLFQAGESVLSALSGCKMLRELSKLESETETKLSMKELAQKFENLAHGRFISLTYSEQEIFGLVMSRVGVVTPKKVIY